jgi:uncharacterized membrane protein
MQLLRAMKHLVMPGWLARRRFGAAGLAEIERAIREAEATHAGEIRFAVEASLDLPELLREETPRERALEVFGQLGVWDTVANNGVLIYVLMADRDVEIVADRGIAAHVSHAEWEHVCRAMEARFRAGDFTGGAVAGVNAAGKLLARHFPRQGGDADELPNQPVLL